jgi:hypothetical protein
MVFFNTTKPLERFAYALQWHLLLLMVGKRLALMLADQPCSHACFALLSLF